MQEHQALHHELYTKNKKATERVKELSDAGAEKDNQIQELEKQLQEAKGSQSQHSSFQHALLLNLLQSFICPVWQTE